jgi:hypothetical protein
MQLLVACCVYWTFLILLLRLNLIGCHIYWTKFTVWGGWDSIRFIFCLYLCCLFFVLCYTFVYLCYTFSFIICVLMLCCLCYWPLGFWLSTLKSRTELNWIFIRILIFNMTAATVHYYYYYYYYYITIIINGVFLLLRLTNT